MNFLKLQTTSQNFPKLNHQIHLNPNPKSKIQKSQKSSKSTNSNPNTQNLPTHHRHQQRSSHQTRRSTYTKQKPITTSRAAIFVASPELECHQRQTNRQDKTTTNSPTKKSKKSQIEEDCDGDRSPK